MEKGLNRKQAMLLRVKVCDAMLEAIGREVYYKGIDNTLIGVLGSSDDWNAIYEFACNLCYDVEGEQE